MPRQRKTGGIDPRAKDIGSRIREAREVLGWKQGELSDAMSKYAKKHGSGAMSQQALSGYEQGSRRPSYEELEALATVLGVSEIWLAGWTALKQKVTAEEQAFLRDFRALSEVQRNNFKQAIRSAARPEPKTAPRVVILPRK